MPGMYCQYCKKQTAKYPHLKMYRFPIKDIQQRNLWIKNSGDATLSGLTLKQLHTKRVCELHFGPDDFANSDKTRLIPKAIPITATTTYPNEDPSTSQQSGFSPSKSPSTLKVRTPKKTYFGPKSSLKSPRRSPENPLTIKQIASTAVKRKLEFENDTPRKKKLKVQVTEQKRNIKNQDRKIRRMKVKLEQFKTQSQLNTMLENFEFSSVNAKALALMQFKTKRQKWTTEERNLSMMLFYKSPSSYEFMRRQGILLPGSSTIRGWIGVSKFEPGLSQYHLEQIHIKFKEYSHNERCCVLCFDEISIAEGLEYSKDLDYIEGYEDLGHLGRSKNTAKFALVFLARGLYSSWKLPIAYFVSHSGLKGVQLANVIVDVIEKLLKVNLLIKATVCDQGAPNRRALSELGVTKSNPSFSVGDQTIFAIYDAPHLIKSVRNNMLSGDFIVESKTISYKDIICVYNIDKKSKKAKALPKLTHAHIFPNPFQKMSVKRATQVLSHSVAAAIRTCVGTGELVNNTALDTADFVDKMDKLFDCLDSRTLFASNVYKCALSDLNTHANNVFDDSIRIFGNIMKVSRKSGKITKPPCFDGIIQTINAIRLLFAAEKQNGIQFILTNRLNQDVLENQFSIYRQKGGYCRNPTVKLIRTIFRSNVINNLMKPPSSSNCEPDSNVETVLPQEASTAFQGSEEEESSSITSTPTESDTSENLEDCSVSYFAGYLAYKCVKKFQCHECEKQLSQDLTIFDKNQLLIVAKLYDSNITTDLKAPSTSFRKIVDISVRMFEKHFHSVAFEKNVGKLLKKKIKKKINKFDEKWLSDPSCQEHRKFIIDHLIHCKLYKSCKLFTPKNFASPKENPKLKILKHL